LSSSAEDYGKYTFQIGVAQTASLKILRIFTRPADEEIGKLCLYRTGARRSAIYSESMMPAGMRLTGAHELLKQHCTLMGLPIEAVQSGFCSSCKYTPLRRGPPRGLDEMGLSHQVVARLPRNSRAGVSQMLQRWR